MSTSAASRMPRRCKFTSLLRDDDDAALCSDASLPSEHGLPGRAQILNSIIQKSSASANADQSVSAYLVWLVTQQIGRRHHQNHTSSERKKENHNRSPEHIFDNVPCENAGIRWQKVEVTTKEISGLGW
jgi:hypothetical protein